MKSSIVALPLFLGLLGFAGLQEGSSSVTTLTAAERAQLEATTVQWPSLDLNSEHPHTVFGDPVYSKPDNQHQIRRQYHGFSVFWDDQVLAPRWTAIKVTSAMADANGTFDRLGDFKVDPKIKDAGLIATKHADYNNLKGSTEWARGHMVQFDDARGWGDQAGEDSFLTSNIAPQLQSHNGAGWLALEMLCTEFARDYKVVWVYSGPIYDKNPKPFLPGRKVPRPRSFYKVVVCPAEDGGVNVLAFIMPHKAVPRSADLSKFVVTVDRVEKETGLDFLRDLPDPVENLIESVKWKIWADL